MKVNFSAYILTLPPWWWSAGYCQDLYGRSSLTKHLSSAGCCGCACCHHIVNEQYPSLIQVLLIFFRYFKCSDNALPSFALGYESLIGNHGFSSKYPGIHGLFCMFAHTLSQQACLVKTAFAESRYMQRNRYYQVEFSGGRACAAQQPAQGSGHPGSG